MNADEIVKVLRKCGGGKRACEKCKYNIEPDEVECRISAMREAANEINHLKAEIFGQADLIESLQAQLAAKDAEIARLKVERDRAVCDLDAFGKGNNTRCGVCKYGSSPCDWCYYDSDGTLNFEWRGAVED